MEKPPARTEVFTKACQCPTFAFRNGWGGEPVNHGAHKVEAPLTTCLNPICAECRRPWLKSQ